MSSDEVRKLYLNSSYGLLRCIPVVDEDGYCLGIIHPCDLFVSQSPRPRPAIIGGMATPFGVYLTDGNLQAGVGNLALVASGALIGLMLLLGQWIVQESLTGAASIFHLPHTRLLDLDYTPPPEQPLLGLASIALKVAMMVVFFIIMRFSILAGYHAAEHQTVHALECEEPLVPDVVRRMPRPHPRCGTNIMAAVALFMGLKELYSYFPVLGASPEIFAALTTLFTWRNVGTFLQEHFTTRAPNQRQLASGIAAGTELIARYCSSPPRRPRLLRKIWCMGLVQSLCGMALAGGAIWVALQFLATLHH